MYAVGPARMIPAAEHDLAAVEHRRIEVVALVERDLMQVVAVGIDDVEDQGGIVQVIVQRVELRLALVEQSRLRLPWARGREDDPPVRQVVRRDVLARLGRDCGRDDYPLRRRWE